MSELVITRDEDGSITVGMIVDGVFVGAVSGLAEGDLIGKIESAS